VEGPPHFVLACSCSSFWRSQNLCIPLDAKIPQYPPVRALNPSIDSSSLTYESLIVNLYDVLERYLVAPTTTEYTDVALAMK
jgi:hypothetical protein